MTRCSGVGRLGAEVYRGTLGVVLVGSRLPLRVCVPNVWTDGRSRGGGVVVGGVV